jgi:hypothetical protein
LTARGSEDYKAARGRPGSAKTSSAHLASFLCHASAKNGADLRAVRRSGHADISRRKSIPMSPGRGCGVHGSIIQGDDGCTSPFEGILGILLVCRSASPAPL